MTKKRFEFKRFYVDVANINKIALYEIDNNPSDDLDDSNLFYIYSTTDANVQQIVDKLNELSEKLYEEQCRTSPIVLTTHISDEDWKKFERLFKIYCDNGCDVDD